MLLVLVLVFFEFIGIISSNVVLNQSDFGGLSAEHDGGVDRGCCFDPFQRDDKDDSSNLIDRARSDVQSRQISMKK